MYCLDGKMQHCVKFLQIVQTWLGGNDKSRILFPDCVGMGEEYLQNTCEFGRKLHIHTLYCGLEFSWVPNTAFWEARYPHHRPSNQEIRNVYSRKGLNQLVLLVGTLASILGFYYLIFFLLVLMFFIFILMIPTTFTSFDIMRLLRFFTLTFLHIVLLTWRFYILPYYFTEAVLEF